MNKNKKLIVVLGMHRSGTSALARGLEVLDIELGDNLQPGMADVNEKGFFEDNDIVSINEELFINLQHDWSSLKTINWELIDTKSLNSIKLRATNLLEEKVQRVEMFAIKDPRTSILLPFWQEIFSDLKLNVKYLIAIRNPLSVAASLYRRDGFSKEKSAYLWAKYLLEAIQETRGLPRVIVDYDNLMNSPAHELKRIRKATNINSVLNKEKLKEFETNFLEDNLRNSQFNIADLKKDSCIPSFVVGFYEVLFKVSSEENSQNDNVVEKALQKVTVLLNEMSQSLFCQPDLEQEISTTKEGKDNLHRVIEVLDHMERIEQFSYDLHEENSFYLANLTQCKKELQEGEEKLQEVTELNQKFERFANELCEGNILSPNDHIYNINEYAKRLNDQISILKESNESYQLSASWKVTRPLRSLSKLFHNTESKQPASLSNSGENESPVKKSHSPVLTTEIEEEQPSETEPLILLDRTDEKFSLKEISVAVHAHILIPDFAFELVDYLENIPTSFDLYVTTDTSEKAKQIKGRFKTINNIKNVDTCVADKRAGNIGPMIIELGQKLTNYEAVLHIHSKDASHNIELKGLRRYLMETLLGGPGLITAILDQFVQEKSLGILYPPVYMPVRQLVEVANNYHHISSILSRAGKKEIEFDNIDINNFPAGSMYWFRGKALELLIALKFSIEDFYLVNDEHDTTLDQTIEKLLPYFAYESDLLVNTYYASSFLKENQLGVMHISLLAKYSRLNLIQKPTLFFDHNLGGGTNQYTRDFLENTLVPISPVLRVYFQDESWFVEWVDKKDGLIFTTEEIEELFEVLNSITSSKIIVNSLYGVPTLRRVVSHIIKLGLNNKISLEYKVHDFYPICPSPHLLDYADKYCEVPDDLKVCEKCFKSNINIDTTRLLSLNITDWRYPFKRLFKAADTISVFNGSSTEILRRAFTVPESKIEVTPHKDYFKQESHLELSGPLHIGIIGTLSIVKGSSVVNKLAEFIKTQGLDIPITVVGQCYTQKHPEVKVLGSYERDSLHGLVQDEGINVILMSSIIPETFSYTVSEVIKMKLPIVAFDIGAQGDRVKSYALGKVVPLESSPDILLSTIKLAWGLGQ
ncbi:MAG: rhamnan synthesis F family protein [Gammaproteobacteria bacterium]